MKINDKQFRPYLAASELESIVGGLARRIDADYAGRRLMVCPVLTGAFMFAADLVRRLSIPCEVAFVRFTSYQGMASTGTVSCSLPFPTDIEGRDVLIVEDVVDTGLSMRHVLDAALALRPASVRICTLLFKPGAFRGDYRVDYVGREIGNEFIVGYGLDYDEAGRSLNEIYVLDQQ